tara:strand:+ start:15349 stop:15990 length:642 start_codon:yes stop_codon:yes gene_type:complete
MYMKTIAICHQKGGVGKSMLTKSLSLELPGNVAVYDSDAQGSTATWLERRQSSGEEKPVPVLGPVKRLPDLVASASSQGFDYFLVDTPPDHESEANIRAAMSVADFVVLPTKMSADDLRILPKTISIANDLGCAWAIILNMGTRSNILTQTEANLTSMAQKLGGHFCPVTLNNRVVHVEATYADATAQEIDPSGLAAEELAQVTKHILKFMEA